MPLPRVRYKERQILRADDLNDEQDYRLAAHRRHLVAQHSWGIVQGLRLRIVPGGFVVLPGVAIDGFGRDLIMPRPIFTPWTVNGGQDLFDAIGSDTFLQPDQPNRMYIDVWLLYDRVPSDPPRRGWQTCQPEPGRWRDDTRLCLTEVRQTDGSIDPSRVDAHRPPLVSDALRPPAPYTDLPGDPQAAWPVFLGRLVRQQDEQKQYPVEIYAVEHDERPYAGLVGASVVSASQVAVAEDPENPLPTPQPPVPSAQIVARAGSGDRRRVTVTLSDDKSALTDAMVLDSAFGATIRGTTTLISPPPDRTGGDDPREPAVDLLIASDTELKLSDLSNPEELACLLNESARPVADPGMSAGRATVIAAVRSRTVARLARRPSVPIGDMAPFLPIFDRPGTWLKDLLEGINDWLADPAPLEPERFADLPLRAVTRELLNAPQGQQPALVKRAVLEDLFPDQIVTRTELSAAHGVEFRPPKQLPKAAAPWRIYSVEFERDGKPVRQLRIEIGTSGDKQHPERNQFVVGHASGEGTDYRFEPCLRVDESCTVFVEGSMTVVGDVIMNPLPTEPGDLGLLEQLAEEWQRGIAEGVQEQANLTVEIRNLDKAQVGTGWPYEVYLKNEGTSPINFISVLEYVSVGGNFDTRTAATILSLPASAEATRPITHPNPDPRLNGASGNVTVMITVLGFGPTFNAMYVSKSKTVPIVQ